MHKKSIPPGRRDAGWVQSLVFHPYVRRCNLPSLSLPNLISNYKKLSIVRDSAENLISINSINCNLPGYHSSNIYSKCRCAS